MNTLLIVEDEVAIRDMILFALNNTDYHLLEADSVKQALLQLHKQIPSLILLDWMLPDASGVAFLSKICKHHDYKNIPVIMLTAKAEEENKIRALEAGADDYITKPFSPLELKTRINVVLRRGPIQAPQQCMHIGKIKINTLSHEVSIDEHPVDLTPIEYKLLHHLARNKKKVYSREQLITHIWGNENYLDERSVDVQIKRLRQRLKPFKCEHHIQTVRGFGYQLSESNE